MNNLFLDIETVPEYPTLSELPRLGQQAFERKFGYMVESGKYPNLNEAYHGEAGLHAEFSKIVCVGFGHVGENNMGQIKGYVGTEKEILGAVCNAMKHRWHTIVAHNGMGFDFPFLCRRLLINGMALPNILNIGTKKPWEVQWEDTAVMWKFNDYKSHVSLITLCYVFGVESPKQEIDGSQVAQAFAEGKIDLINKYCKQDVRALMEVYMKINCLPKISEFVIHD